MVTPAERSTKRRYININVGDQVPDTRGRFAPREKPVQPEEQPTLPSNIDIPTLTSQVEKENQEGGIFDIVKDSLFTGLGGLASGFTMANAPYLGHYISAFRDNDSPNTDISREESERSTINTILSFIPNIQHSELPFVGLIGKPYSVPWSDTQGRILGKDPILGDLNIWDYIYGVGLEGLKAKGGSWKTGIGFQTGPEIIHSKLASLSEKMPEINFYTNEKQLKITEKSEDIIIDLFTGKMDYYDAVKALSDNHKERGWKVNLPEELIADILLTGGITKLSRLAGASPFFEHGSERIVKGIAGGLAENQAFWSKHVPPSIYPEAPIRRTPSGRRPGMRGVQRTYVTPAAARVADVIPGSQPVTSREASQRMVQGVSPFGTLSRSVEARAADEGMSIGDWFRHNLREETAESIELPRGSKKQQEKILVEEGMGYFPTRGKSGLGIPTKEGEVQRVYPRQKVGKEAKVGEYLSPGYTIIRSPSRGRVFKTSVITIKDSKANVVWELPRSVDKLMQSSKGSSLRKGKAFIKLSASELSEVKAFLKHYGTDWADAEVGKAVYIPSVNRSGFVVGSYDNPIWGHTKGWFAGSSRSPKDPINWDPELRSYILYDPQDNTFFHSFGKGEPTKIFASGRGQSVQRGIMGGTLRRFDGKDIEAWEKKLNFFWGKTANDVMDRGSQRPPGSTLDGPATKYVSEGGSGGSHMRQLTKSVIEEGQKNPDQSISDTAAEVIEGIMPGAGDNVIGSKGTSLEHALHMAINKAETTEQATDLFREWAGKRQTDLKDAMLWWQETHALMKAQGIGRTLKEGAFDYQKIDDSKFLIPFHDSENGRDVSEQFKWLFNRIQERVQVEEAKMLGWDNKHWEKIIADNPNYLHRQWYFPDARGKLDPSSHPSFMKNRTGKSYAEILKEGGIPLSNNPADMVVLREMAGIEYRESMILGEAFRNKGLLKSQEEINEIIESAINEVDREKLRKFFKNWRSPKVETFKGRMKNLGTAWGQKMVKGPNGVPESTATYLMPGNLAKSMEAIHSVPTGPVKAIISLATWSKRTILSFALGQFNDFFNRTMAHVMGEAFSLTTAQTGLGWTKSPVSIRFQPLAKALIVGEEGKVWTSYAGELIDKSLFRRGTIKDIEKSILSDPMLRLTSEAGWNWSGDPTFVSREIKRGLATLLEEESMFSITGPTGALEESGSRFGVVTKRLAGVREFYESTLFDIAYPLSQKFVLQNVIFPKLRRAHPQWTDKEIADAAAPLINEAFSSIPVWQSAIQSRGFMNVLRSILISPAEQESWIRMGLNWIPGAHRIPLVKRLVPHKGNIHKRVTSDFWLGYYIWLAMFGNAVNLIATGRPMSLDQYNPITIDDRNSTFGIPVGYNSRFMRPVLPGIKGKNGEDLYLDVVGQADTFFKLVLDPAQASISRAGGPVRSMWNQTRGTTFFGDDFIDRDEAHFSPKNTIRRAAQLAQDIAMPISLGSAIQPGVKYIPSLDQLIHPMEAQLGTGGAIFQGISGYNISSPSSRDIQNELARDNGYPSWKDVDKGAQIRMLKENPSTAAQIKSREEIAAQRGSSYRDNLSKINDQYFNQEDALAESFRSGTMGGIQFWESYDDIQQNRAGDLRGLHNSFSDNRYRDENRLPKDPNAKALRQYFKVYEDNKLPTGKLDWNQINIDLDRWDNIWTPEQKQWVSSNTKVMERHPASVQQMLVERRDYIRRWEAVPREIIKDPIVLQAYYEAYSKKRSKDWIRRSGYPQIEQLRKQVKAMRDELLKDPEMKRILKKYHIISQERK